MPMTNRGRVSPATSKGLEIDQGANYQRLLGKFGELLICSWLSRSGFDVFVVDHTGIDLVAYHPATGQRFGITVKARTRVKGREHVSTHVFNNNKKDRAKMDSACNATESDPWIAVYVETTDRADIFLTSRDNYDKKYRSRPDRVVDDWKMTAAWLAKYARDSEVHHLRIEFRPINWTWGTSLPDAS